MNEKSMSSITTVEIVIKISEVPQARVIENNCREFSVDVLGKEVVIKLKQKAFAKLEKAPTDYPEWVAKITGKLGEKTPKGFVLLEPTLAIFQKQTQNPEPSLSLTKKD